MSNKIANPPDSEQLEAVRKEAVQTDNYDIHLVISLLLHTGILKKELTQSKFGLFKKLG